MNEKIANAAVLNQRKAFKVIKLRQKIDHISGNTDRAWAFLINKYISTIELYYGAPAPFSFRDIPRNSSPFIYVQYIDQKPVLKLSFGGHHLGARAIPIEYTTMFHEGTQLGWAGTQVPSADPEDNIPTLGRLHFSTTLEC